MQTIGYIATGDQWQPADHRRQRSTSFAALLEAKAREYGHRPALTCHGDDRGEDFTYRDLARRSAVICDYLVESGAKPSDRIAILSESRPRWGLVFFSILRAGAVVVPLDPHQNEAEIEAILDDAEPVILVVSAQFTALGRHLQRTRPGLKQVLSLEPEVQALYFESIDRLRAQRRYPRHRSYPNAAAVLSYTSGTLGQPKGVLTTYGNLLSQVSGIRQVMGNDSDTRCVSILPLNHLFELTVTFLGVLYGGGKICYVNSLLPEDVTAAMRRHRVTCMIVVPLFLKLIHKNIRQQLDKVPRWQQRLFTAGFAIAPVLPQFFRRLLFYPVHARFGGSLRYFVSGGAPLESDTIRFFDRIGIKVYQGYGMAEASPVIATNTVTANKPGSVGKPLPGIEIKIKGPGKRGEILTRGPQVMLGYFNKPELTAQVVDAEGWLHTGDIGEFDRDGYLHVNGREKNLIVLASGKKVHPEELELVLFDDPGIREGCIVSAESRLGLQAGCEEITAVVVPSDDLLRDYGADDSALNLHLADIVRARATRLSRWKRPTRVVVSRSELPKTATRKIKRREVVQELFAGE